MRPMLNLQALRQARFLARCVLAWFVVSVGIAIASPMVQPQSYQLVCSAVGEVKLLAANGEGQATPAAHALDCVLCLTLGAPPPQGARAKVAPPLPMAAIAFASAPPHTLRIAAPPPARGPPPSI